MKSVYSTVVAVPEPVCVLAGQQILMGHEQGNNWLIGPLSGPATAFFRLSAFENTVAGILADWRTGPLRDRP